MPTQLVNWCEDRAATPLGSTRGDPEARYFGEKPLFSQDAAQNPMFHDWHVVFLRYCDGSSFSSRAGRGNFKAILHELVRAGLGRAAEVVVSGCSAGALSAALHADSVHRVAPQAVVAALIDSGVFPDWSQQGSGGETSEQLVGDGIPGAPVGIWPLDVQLRRAFAQHGLEHSGALPADCLAAHADAPWRCIFLEHLLPFVHMPAFVLQSRFDSSNVKDVEASAGLQELGEAVTWRLDNALAQPETAHGLFLDSCFHHCMNWGQIVAGAGEDDGPTQVEAFAAWWRDHVLAADRAGPHRGKLPRPRWEHRPQIGAGSSRGPCLEEACCARATADLAFWQGAFSGAAVPQAHVQEADRSSSGGGGSGDSSADL